MSKTKVLIAGASGFIGRNLFEHFNSIDKYKVCGTYLKNIPYISSPLIFQADLRNLDAALSATQGMNIVINAAALTAGLGVFSKPGKLEMFRNENNKVNKNLAEAACVNKVRHFIFLSCTVMYPSSNVPLSEDEVSLAKIHPKYSVAADTKLFGEAQCRHYSDLGITKYTVARHSNIYGPHDKFDLERGHVLAATIEKVMNSDRNIVVWGYGLESRDFLYIDDLIGFIESATLGQVNNFEIFNVGFGKTSSINELVEKVILCSGKNLGITHDIKKPSIETHMSIDVQKAKKLLGWQAKINLDQGLARTIKWYQTNH